jgi:hypothetical protein
MSRAQILDEREEEVLESQEPEQAQEVAEEQPSIPEKYRGKSLEDLVQMHQEAEKLVGRQGDEVGELRKVVDEYIRTQLQEGQAPKQQQEPDEEVDFFVDPKKAVSKAIENHPKIREAEEYSQQYRKQNALAQLQAKHPDMQNILKDAKFAEWVKASKVRTRLFVEADQEYNYESADELFSLWKDRAAVVQQTNNVEQQARKQSLKAASTGNARGTGEAARKKIYRRADIIKLMKTDPERYQSLSDEIFKAYAEGRVR